MENTESVSRAYRPSNPTPNRNWFHQIRACLASRNLEALKPHRGLRRLVPSRSFGRKLFHARGIFGTTKALAKSQARTLKKSGHYVRVSRHDGGWSVFARRK